MQRFDDLGQLLTHIWTFIEDGPQDFKHPFATPTFVTTGPDARTITLRGADRARRTLTFHSDVRAAKVEELRRDASVAFHCWDPARKQQLVLHGEATVHTDDGVADRLWKVEPPSALKIYRKPDASGTRVDAPASGVLPLDTESEPTHEDVAEGRPHFAVVQTLIDRIDWLHAHSEGHYRARFRWNGEAFDGHWVLP